MKRIALPTLLLPVVLVALAIFAGCCINIGDLYKAKYERTEELTASLADITTLHVETDVGAITLNPADVTECRITAVIKAKDKTTELAQQIAEQIEIVAVPVGNTLKIHAENLPPKSGSKIAIDYTITAPKHLDVNCKTDVGSVKITDFEGRIEADCDVGSVTCKGARGSVHASVDVGDVTVKYAADAPAELDVDLGSDVGSITFEGPAEISAELDASTSVGGISTARPLTVRGKIGKSVTATLGQGQGKIKLKTDVGSINIR